MCNKQWFLNYFYRMKITLLFFGITTDLIGEQQVNFTLEKELSVASFRELLHDRFPTLTNLDSYAIAVNEEYANDTDFIKSNDIVAIIPPVSGG